MKRILCILLTVLLLAGLAGCLTEGPAAEPGSFSLAVNTLTPDENTKGPGESPADSTAAPSTERTDTVPTERTEAAPTETGAAPGGETVGPGTAPALTVTEDGVYDSKEEVALYIHLFGHLPSNYITKKEAEALGWPGGSLEPYAPGKCIGGSHFGNYEGKLPDAKGRKWTECDIDTLGASKRGAKRIIFSNDGLIYYTGDHYEHFELLYDGTEG